MKRLPALVKLMLGLLILAASFVFGLRTRLFYNHMLFPLGFWLVFDAIDMMLTGKSYFRRLGRAEGLAMLGFAGLFGVILDYHMVVLTGILEFYAIRNPFTALQMYVGWAFCLPAIYESYVVVMHLLEPPLLTKEGPAQQEEVNSSEVSPSQEGAQETFPPSPHPSSPYRLPPAFRSLRLIGMLFIAIPIFSAMWRKESPGYLLIFSFMGMFFMMEYIQWRRGRTTLLAANLSSNWRPWVGMIIASLPYTILWEGLNGMMGSWIYRRIFWLEPRILTIPLVAYFGYLFWYILFLSLLNALSERDPGAWVKME